MSVDVMNGAAPTRFAVVVPVKAGPAAKSRLRPPPGITRADVARAIALDTLEAVSRTPATRLVVVTSDHDVADVARELGALCLADPGEGLNAAIQAGVRLARTHAGDAEAVAALLGDLPCLRPDDLSAALRAAASHRQAFVPDLEGTGTVLLTARSAPLTARFGSGSAAAHALLATRLDLDLPRLRRDIDVTENLRDAAALGLGAHTQALLDGIGDELATELGA